MVSSLGVLFALVMLLAPEAAAHPPAPVQTPSAAAAFFDRIVPALLERYHIPGATVALVADGRMEFAAGYGLADIERATPVDPSRTPFHIGSLTKLFTWTAAMQLVEQGQLDLDTDVNVYLAASGDADGLRIPPAFGRRPVTLRHLMTHTAGFEDSLINLFRFHLDGLIPLARYVRRYRPRRIYPPGTIVAYSNYGAALAGYLVERVSGEPYDEYIDRHILRPLGMTHTTARQPAAAPSDPIGYTTLLPGAGPVGVHEYILPAPAGGMSSTGHDMARFMLAHLRGAAGKAPALLRADTLRQMQSTHFRSAPDLPGLTLGFMEWNRNGRRILWHSGGTAVFYSMLMLFPDDGVGLFYSFNASGGERARWELADEFLRHFFPHVPPPVSPLPDHAQRVHRYVGLYRQSRFGFSGIDRLLYAFRSVERASANPDGTLHYLDRDWVEVGEGRFREIGGDATLVFQFGRDGRPVRVLQDLQPHEVQIRLQALEHPLLPILPCLVAFLIWLW